jgi:hypothetical protein
MPHQPVARKKVKLPLAKPRNPVQRALLGKTLAVGAGKHGKSAGAKRQAGKQALRDELQRHSGAPGVP